MNRTLHAYKPDPALRKMHEHICRCPECKGTLLRARMCDVCREMDLAIERVLKKRKQAK
jgi:hypothetical protein